MIPTIENNTHFTHLPSLILNTFGHTPAILNKIILTHDQKIKELDKARGRYFQEYGKIYVLVPRSIPSTRYILYRLAPRELYRWIAFTTIEGATLSTLMHEITHCKRQNNLEYSALHYDQAPQASFEEECSAHEAEYLFTTSNKLGIEIPPPPDEIIKYTGQGFMGIRRVDVAKCGGSAPKRCGI